MTTILALNESGSLYIASDSQVTIGGSKVSTSDKVFKKGEMLIGCCGDARFGKILKYSFNIPKQGNEDDYDYLNTKFVDSLMDCLDRKQYNKKYDSKVDNESTAVICYKKHIYLLSCDYDVSEFDNCNFYAVGSGAKFAIGSMETIANINKSCKELNVSQIGPEESIKLSIKAACINDIYTSGDVKILSMENG